MDGARILHRIRHLGVISEDAPRLTRTYLTDTHRQANELVATWMREAGMAVRTDAVGNIIGRYEGRTPGLPALMIGSHLDTVRDAGKYDGMLGVVVGIECVAALHAEHERKGFAVEVVGFANEEGARFGATLTGSRAVAGTLDAAQLESRDAHGVTMAEAMRDFGLDPAKIGEAARRRNELLAYVEVHIEQGPVLEARDLSVGVVTAISGATRLMIELTGVAGHAGTVPMTQRHDALAAAAEAILTVERHCQGTAGLVGTVGRIEALPGAINVIPGVARFTIDIRAEQDADREAAVSRVTDDLIQIAERRRIGVDVKKLHEASSCLCAPPLMAALERAVDVIGGGKHFEALGLKPSFESMRLPSGAGHDAMAIAAITDVAMLFVRCKAGISHNPAESVSPADALTAAQTLRQFIRELRPPRRAAP
jgi:allantoate deiminase